MDRPLTNNGPQGQAALAGALRLTVIPGLTDHELEQILTAARDAGASAASWIALRLPREVSPLFQDWLARNEPGRATRVMRAVRDLHGGLDYDPEWGTRMRGQGQWSGLTAQRFAKAVARLGPHERLAALRPVPAAPGTRRPADAVLTPFHLGAHIPGVRGQRPRRG